MRIGVTGGAGYIGAHVTRDLLDRGHEVLVLDSLVAGSRTNTLDQGAGFHFLEGDVRDPRALAAFFDFEPDTVFHFAASKAAGESMLVPEAYSDNNIRGTLHLLETMIRRGCRHLVFSSSAAVYGAPRYIPLDEEHPCVPENYYGFTKLCIEQNLAWFSRLRGLRFAALRYFNAAGYDPSGRVRGLETNPQNLLPILMEAASGSRPQIEVFGTDYETRDGSCVRDYIHVSDLSRAHLLSMDYIRSNDRDLTVNLGAGNGVTVLEMLEVARRVTGRAIPHVTSGRRAGDPPALVSSARLAEQLLGWKAEHSDPVTLVETTWRVYREAS